MPQPRPGQRPLLSQRLRDETLVCTSDDGVCALNGTASQLLALCDGTRTRGEIAREFADLYPEEDRQRLTDDALQALACLEAYGLTE